MLLMCNLFTAPPFHMAVTHPHFYDIRFHESTPCFGLNPCLRSLPASHFVNNGAATYKSLNPFISLTGRSAMLFISSARPH